MSKATALLLLFFTMLSFSQDKNGRHYYHVDIANAESLEISEKEDGTLEVFALNSQKETAIFNKYSVYILQPAFPNTRKTNLKKVYNVVTDSPVLLGQLQNENPDKYTNISEYFPTPNAYYPNDYGTTSPVENLGAPYPATALDLINAPGAWGITKGDQKVVIGISDAKVDSTNTDLQGRVSNYLKYFDVTKGGTCSHGTGIAAIIGGKMDNAHGIPGLCSDCDMITNGYAQFDYIQELVEAGAKVINISWALCGFGSYHKNVEERINEYYEEGVLLVAGAGNAKKCHPYIKDRAASYTYPAAYEKVIAVTMVYAECGHYEDCIVEDEEYGTIANKLKDRHVRRQRMEEHGNFNKLQSINTQWATQHNLSIDLAAPAEAFSSGREACGDTVRFAGLTSNAAPFVTGTIGLIWSANYCLGSAEVESILKLTSEDIEHLPGNEHLKMMLGAGRLNAYRAVKMADEMQQKKGVVTVSERDFYRFDFKLESSPYAIAIKNQTFRDSSTVDFTARNQIRLLPGSRFSPDENGFAHLRTNPDLPTGPCEPTTPKKRPKVQKDSVYSAPKHTPPFEINQLKSEVGLEIIPHKTEADSNYRVVVKQGTKTIFSKNYSQEQSASIPLEKWEDQVVEVLITTQEKRMTRKLRVLPKNRNRN